MDSRGATYVYILPCFVVVPLDEPFGGRGLLSPPSTGVSDGAGVFELVASPFGFVEPSPVIIGTVAAVLGAETMPEEEELLLFRFAPTPTPTPTPTPMMTTKRTTAMMIHFVLPPFLADGVAAARSMGSAAALGDSSLPAYLFCEGESGPGCDGVVRPGAGVAGLPCSSKSGSYPSYVSRISERRVNARIIP